MHDNRYGIDESTLRVVVPSLYASQPHSNMSDKYSYANTRQLIDPLLQRGWQVGTAGQARTRNAEKQHTTNFMLSLFHPQHTLAHVASQPRIIIQDSHDGTKALRINLGIFRFVCSNGLIVGDSFYQKRIRHNTVNLWDDAMLAFDETINSVDKLKQLTERLSHHVTESVAAEFADQAYALRFGRDEPSVKFHTSQLLNIRRYDDMQRTAWTVFNVVQENLLRGGQRYRTTSNRRMTTREVVSIPEQTRINQQLFDLALETLTE